MTTWNSSRASGSSTALSRTDEIERVTGYELPEGGYDTIAGLVLDRLERIPEVGEHVTVDGVRIDVLAVEEFAIQQVRLSIAQRDADEDHDDDHDHDHTTTTTGTTGRPNDRIGRALMVGSVDAVSLVLAAGESQRIDFHAPALLVALVLLGLNGFFVAVRVRPPRGAALEDRTAGRGGRQVVPTTRSPGCASSR